MAVHDIEELELSEEQVKDFMQVFTLYDKNKDGTIEQKEVRSLLISLGHCLTEADVRSMITELGIDAKKNVDFSDFLLILRKLVKSHFVATEDQIRDTFKTFDRNNDGFISEEEFKITLDHLGEKMSESEIKEMIKEVDLNGDGQVDENEFMEMMTK